MSQLLTILWAKRRIAAHALASVRHESYLKLGVLGTAGVLLWTGVLLACARAFWWLQYEAFQASAPNEAIGLADILMVRLLAIFALALFFLLIFSNTLIAFSTLYKAREVQFLLHAPVTIPTFFVARFIECVSISSWASAFLGSPIVIAYGLVTNAHAAYYLAAVAFYVPFVMIPAALGSIIILLLVLIFPSLPRIALLSLGLGAAVGLFFYIQGAFSAAGIGEENIVSVILEATSQTQSPLLPSYWLAQGILSAAEGHFSDSLFLFGLLLSNALMLTWVAAMLARAVFLSGFSAILGSDRNQERPLGRGILGRLDAPARFLPNPLRALVLKDIRLFWRDPTQWSQFLIFFGIMAVYVSNLRNRSFELDFEGYRTWVASLTSAACALILASLTSRFVFPLVSLEGFRFWILGLAPLTLRQLVWQKFWLSVATTAPISISLVVVSCYLLEVSTTIFVVAVGGISLANFTLAGLAVGLGSLYPNFEEDNPARIVSGMGGTLNFLLSIGYIVLLIGSQMFILLSDFGRQWYFVVLLIAFHVAVSIIGTIFPMRLGLRNLMQMEF